MAGWTPSQIPSFADPNASTTGGSSSSSTLMGSGGSSIPSIAAPNVTPFTYSADSQSYPTFLRNLGENTAQQAFQRQTNRIGAGNSQQNLMHAQDDLNQSRLGYMSQAGQQQLGVDNAMADNWNKYNSLLAQLYGTQVQQRGQDVSYAGQIGASSLNNQARNSGVMTLGGGGSTQLKALMAQGGDWGGQSMEQSLGNGGYSSNFQNALADSSTGGWI